MSKLTYQESITSKFRGDGAAFRIQVTAYLCGVEIGSADEPAPQITAARVARLQDGQPRSSDEIAAACKIEDPDVLPRLRRAALAVGMDKMVELRAAIDEILT